VHVQSQARRDQLLGEWVIIASHRQDRTFQPAAGQCPLCPSSAGSLTEMPAPDFEVVVFENRFPTLRAQGTDTGDGDHGTAAGRQPAAAAASGSPPDISAWHQAQVRRSRDDDFALHLELFTIRRAPGKLKYPAGSESGMGGCANDVVPEAAKRLREFG
jgi:galactose-1-phosphate uridylyltransferase